MVKLVYLGVLYEASTPNVTRWVNLSTDWLMWNTMAQSYTKTVHSAHRKQEVMSSYYSRYITEGLGGS